VTNYPDEYISKSKSFAATPLKVLNRKKSSDIVPSNRNSLHNQLNPYDFQSTPQLKIPKDEGDTFRRNKLRSPGSMPLIQN